MLVRSIPCAKSSILCDLAKIAVFIMQRRIRMGLFGPSKKERMLQAEIDRLKSMLLPEQQEIEVLNQQIESLQTTISNLNTAISNNNSKISEQHTSINTLDQEIAEKRKQLAVFEVDISSLDYGLYITLLQSQYYFLQKVKGAAE